MQISSTNKCDQKFNSSVATALDEIIVFFSFQAGLAGVLGLAGSGNVQVEWLNPYLLCMQHAA
jgi:hypothetical protein